jgi:hypothetical protein
VFLLRVENLLFGDSDGRLLCDGVLGHEDSHEIEEVTGLVAVLMRLLLFRPAVVIVQQG